MEPSVTLDYRRELDDRPRWATRLGMTGIVLGVLGLIGGALRVRDAWTTVFDPTFRWIHPPASWVPPAYLVAVLVGVVVSVVLLTAGISSLIKPFAGRRLFLLYAVCKLPLVALTAVLRMQQSSANPDVPSGLLASEVVVECLIFGAYPAFVLWFALRQVRATRDGRTAAV